jgi:hypothetical protein
LKELPLQASLNPEIRFLLSHHKRKFKNYFTLYCKTGQLLVFHKNKFN